MPNINKEDNMKEILLIALAFLSGILLLSASIVWESAVSVVNSCKKLGIKWQSSIKSHGHSLQH